VGTRTPDLYRVKAVIIGTAAPHHTEGPAVKALLILTTMPQSPDKRRRSDLDLFVLALIETGITTPYELQISAGLSPGATIPALRRLVAGGWASPAKPGPRGRTEHRLTAAGRRHLESGWRQLIEDGPSGDGDADLRVALLALFVGADRRLATEFLRRSAENKRSSLEEGRPANDQTDQPPLAAWYQRLRSEASKALARAAVSSMQAMAKRLPARTNTGLRSK
jgi:DNA-binding PadR family transcriptional regulator